MKELQEAFFGIRILRVRILVLVRPCHDEIPEIPVISEIPEILEIPGIPEIPEIPEIPARRTKKFLFK